MHFRKLNNCGKILQIFGGLVLGCIKTKFCNKICVWQHFSSSTRFASFCTAAISKFSQKIGLKNCEFRKISENFRKFWQILLIFWKKCDFGAVQRSALCRSRRELSNAYLLAKFGFDTAENVPCHVCPIVRHSSGIICSSGMNCRRSLRIGPAACRTAWRRRGCWTSSTSGASERPTCPRGRPATKLDLTPS